MELKDKLEDLSKGFTRSAHIRRFLTNISDSDYTEDARALERSSATLEESMKAIW